MSQPSVLQRYQNDPGSAYSMSVDELRELLAEVGEDDAIVDALAVTEGQSDEARAELIGVTVADIRWTS